MLPIKPYDRRRLADPTMTTFSRPSRRPARMVSRVACCAAVIALTFSTEASAQQRTPDEQIKAAIAPAPVEMQEGARVLGYSAEGELVTLREGTNDVICLADDPKDDRFHVACYHESLEPFMARGRELTAEGKSREEIQQIREDEANREVFKMPEAPAALYSFTGPVDSFDYETGELDGSGRLYVVYIPYATAETTGLSTTPATGSPWLMNPGKPWAHIMLIPGGSN